MNFPKFFIERPIFATVLSLMLLVGGGICLFILPVDQYPDITPPTVQVTANYPGANAETIAQTVGIPIEQQVNGVDGMIYMSSTSSSAGTYQLTVTFEVGTDIDMATVLVQNRVNVAMNSLPSEVTQLGVTVQKQSTNIVLFLTLTGDSIYDQLYLSNYAKLQITDQLSRVSGVGAVNIMGAGDYSMRVWLNPETMRIRGVTPAEVYSAISQQNMAVSAGYVGQTLNKNADNAFQYTLNVQGRLKNKEEFGNIVVKNDGISILRLKDIATIELGSETYSASSRLNGKPTAALAVYQSPGSNALDVSKAIRAKMEQLAEDFPPGVNYQVTLDTTNVVRSSIREVLYTLLETTLLVVFVIFLFLQNWRATLILPDNSRIADRYAGTDGAVGILDKHTYTFRAYSCHCHSGGRRNSGGGECHAHTRRGETVAKSRNGKSDGGDYKSHHRRCTCDDGCISAHDDDKRNFGTALQTVCADHCRVYPAEWL